MMRDTMNRDTVMRDAMNRDTEMRAHRSQASTYRVTNRRVTPYRVTLFECQLPGVTKNLTRPASSLTRIRTQFIVG